MRGGFGDHRSWQAQRLVNLDVALKGSNISFCELSVFFDLGHDDCSMGQVQQFGCLRLIFGGRRSTLSIKHRFSDFQLFFCGARGVQGEILTLAQPSSVYAPQIALIVALCSF